MKVFSSLNEGLHYKEKCIFCKSDIRVDDNKSIEDNKLLFYLSAASNEAISIDINTEEVEFTKVTYKLPFRSKYTNLAGFFYTSLHIGCQECFRYDFSLQLSFDLYNKKFMNAALNMESFTFEENDLICEIRNNYGANKCSLISHPSEGNNVVIDFPIIEVNMDNPKETLDKMRKMVLFL